MTRREASVRGEPYEAALKKLSTILCLDLDSLSVLYNSPNSLTPPYCTYFLRISHYEKIYLTRLLAYGSYPCVYWEYVWCIPYWLPATPLTIEPSSPHLAAGGNA